jgi:hypothetical protein
MALVLEPEDRRCGWGRFWVIPKAMRSSCGLSSISEMTAPQAEALKLQRPLPDGARGGKTDEPMVTAKVPTGQLL